MLIIFLPQQEKVDDLTSLNWLQSLNIFQNVSHQQKKPLEEKHEITNSLREEIIEQIGCEAAAHSEISKVVSSENNGGVSPCSKKQEVHRKIQSRTEQPDERYEAVPISHNNLNKKIQIQQKTSVKSLCLHFSVLSQV